MTSQRITFITPLFSKGSYEDQPEIRPSSIRGQLHWWFRALGGKATDENQIFGSVHSKPVHASKVVVRVSNVVGKTGEVNTLPHKYGGQASPKWALVSSTTFDLHLLERLGGLSSIQRSAFAKAVEAWLLLGTIGLRATRACGSFGWHPLTDGAFTMPTSLEQWQSQCDILLQDAPLKAYLVTQPFDTAEQARRIVSDTIGGRDDRQGEDSLAALNYPLGKIRPGGRKTSPLRFRIIPIGSQFHIAAVWDNRSLITGNSADDLRSVIQLLASQGKTLGQLLADFRITAANRL